MKTQKKHVPTTTVLHQQDLNITPHGDAYGTQLEVPIKQCKYVQSYCKKYQDQLNAQMYYKKNVASVSTLFLVNHSS